MHSSSSLCYFLLPGFHSARLASLSETLKQEVKAQGVELVLCFNLSWAFEESLPTSQT